MIEDYDNRIIIMGEREIWAFFGKASASLLARRNWTAFEINKVCTYLQFALCHVWLVFDWPYIPYWTIDRFTVTLSSKRPLTTDLYLTLALLVSRTRRLPWPWDAHSRQLQGKVVVFFLPAGFISKKILYLSFKDRSRRATREG